jgi:carbonic anhydrase/acetyltransferase-like protein (isoleucine patch superfamily)
MPLYSLDGRAPQVHPTAFIAPTAVLVGAVVVEAGASVWYGAVLRADMGRILIREGANIQDNSVLHGDTDPSIEIGRGATVAHLCVVHGCTVGEEALVGNGTTVQDGCVIGARAMIGAGSLLTPGTVVPPETMWLGAPAKLRGPLSDTARIYVDGNPAGYQALAALHAGGLVELP